MDSKTYDELHGINNWDGLLDPLNQALRSLILGYGDLASAAERALNNDEGSKYCGYSRYGKSLFFKGLMLPWADSNYDVVSFIYATSHIDADLALLFPGMSREGSEFESNWMGYVAVSNDQYSKSIGRREVCVVWRGTVRTYEWIDDILGAMPVSAEPLFPTGVAADTAQVMGGWLTIYNTCDPDSEFVETSARTQLLAEIKKLMDQYKNEKVSITVVGHSLGASLAVLSAFDVAVNTPDINVSAFVFACPQVANEAFKEKMEGLTNLKVLRVTNKLDIIPLWPSKLLKKIEENTWVTVPSGLLDYVDVGIEILIDTQKSPYVKDESGLSGKLHPLVFHNLQGMLHAFAGWNGENGKFDWGLLKRSLGLVNMSTDLLKEDYKIPVSWWVEKNKGMVLNDDGDWVLLKPDPEDHDVAVY